MAADPGHPRGVTDLPALSDVSVTEWRAVDPVQHGLFPVLRHSLMLALLNGGQNCIFCPQKASTRHSLMLALLNGGVFELARVCGLFLALSDVSVTEWRISTVSLLELGGVRHSLMLALLNGGVPWSTAARRRMTGTL